MDMWHLTKGKMNVILALSYTTHLFNTVTLCTLCFKYLCSLGGISLWYISHFITVREIRKFSNFMWLARKCATGRCMYTLCLPLDFRVAWCSLYLQSFIPLSPKLWYSTENRPQQRELHALLLANSVWVLLCPTASMLNGLRQGYSLLSLCD